MKTIIIEDKMFYLNINKAIELGLIARPEKRQSTKKQQTAIKYCEKWLEISFKGDINNFYDCHAFLSKYLEDAKDVAIYHSVEVL